MAIVKNTTASTDEWKAGGVPITMMMNMERRNGEMKPVIRKALVELEGAPFLKFCSKRMSGLRIHASFILVLSSIGVLLLFATVPHALSVLSRVASNSLL